MSENLLPRPGLLGPHLPRLFLGKREQLGAVASIVRSRSFKNSGNDFESDMENRRDFRTRK